MTRGARPRACLAGRPYIDHSATGPLHEPERPMFVFDRELGILERAFYRHLRGVIDLDALFGLEQLLWSELQELDLFTDDQLLDISNAILARSLERVANDPLRSMRSGTLGPGGEILEVPEEPHGDCPFCGPSGHGGGGRTGPGPDPCGRTGPGPGLSSGAELAREVVS